MCWRWWPSAVGRALFHSTEGAGSLESKHQQAVAVVNVRRDCFKQLVLRLDARLLQDAVADINFWGNDPIGPLVQDQMWRHGVGGGGNVQIFVERIIVQRLRADEAECVAGARACVIARRGPLD